MVTCYSMGGISCRCMYKVSLSSCEHMYEEPHVLLSYNIVWGAFPVDACME